MVPCVSGKSMTWSSSTKDFRLGAQTFLMVERAPKSMVKPAFHFTEVVVVGDAGRLHPPHSLAKVRLLAEFGVAAVKPPLCRSGDIVVGLHSAGVRPLEDHDGIPDAFDELMRL